MTLDTLHIVFFGDLYSTKKYMKYRKYCKKIIYTLKPGLLVVHKEFCTIFQKTKKNIFFFSLFELRSMPIDDCLVEGKVWLKGKAHMGIDNITTSKVDPFTAC